MLIVVLVIIWLSLGYLGFAVQKGYFVRMHANQAEDEIKNFCQELTCMTLLGFIMFTATGIFLLMVSGKPFCKPIFTTRQIQRFIENQ
jgi:hypothetical protein